MKSRKFRLWHYSCIHSTLIIRSTKAEEHPNTIDYVFSAVEQIHCPEIMTNLVVTETGAVNSIMDKGFRSKEFTLSCEEGKFTIIGLAFKRYETLLEHWDVQPYLPDDHTIERELYCYSLTKPLTGVGTFAKQVGGCGQYGNIEIRLEATTDFIGRVKIESLGDIPEEYVPAIRETFYRCQKQWPSLDLPASLIDMVITGGICIPADESQFAYIQASILAWQNAIYKAQGCSYLQKMELAFENGKACHKIAID